MMLLHGEENLEVFKLMQAGENYLVEEKIVDCQYKKKMAIIYFEYLIKNEQTKELMARVLTSIIIRGVTEFPCTPTIKVIYPKIPQRLPDSIAEEYLPPGQAFLYRLNSDRNPLHVDPDMAELGGFAKPIIHGLCTYGFTARVIYEKYFQGEP